MKKLIEQVEGEGLESLLGEMVEIWCECYIYHGKLIGVNDNDILLDNASIIYETGPLNEAGYKDIQTFGLKQRYIRVSKIESYGLAL